MIDLPEPEEGLTAFSATRFVDEVVIGTGVNAVVFRAWDAHLQREVALKLSIHDTLLQKLGVERLDEAGITAGVRQLIDDARADRERRYTLLREARLLARIDHPNVIATLECGVLPSGVVVLVLPYLEGGSLDEHGFAGEPWQAVLGVALQIGRGLAAIHEAGLLHRDFKPDNVIFGADGRPRIADLGLACWIDDAEAMADFAGSTDYMAPEVLDGRARDVRDDVYAYALVVYQMFYGHGPFDSSEARDAGRVLRSIRPGEMPPALHEILERGLAPDPERRWPDMPTLLRALDDLRLPQKPRRRWPWVAAGLGVAASVALGVLTATSSVWAGACDGVADELAGSWSPEIAAELRGVTGTRKGSDRLQDWATRWIAARERECETHETHEASTPSPCLARARDSFRVTIASLRTPHLREGLALAAVLDELPAPERCLDHPDDADELGRSGLLELRELDLELATLIALTDLERARARQARYMQLARAHASGYDVGRAIYWRGELRRLAGELDDADRDFGLALEQAEAIGARLLAAEASLKLTQVAGARGELGAVDAYARAARARLASVDPDRVAELLRIQGASLLAGDDGDRERAIALLQEAVAMRTDQHERYGGSRERVGVALEALARGQLAIGAYDRAIETTRRSLEIHTRSFGDSTPGARELRRLLFHGQVASGRSGDAHTTAWDILTPLLQDQDYDAYFMEIAWFAERSRDLGAVAFSEYWLAEARNDAENIQADAGGRDRGHGPPVDDR